MHILLKKGNFGFSFVLCGIEGLLFIVHLTKTQVTKVISKKLSTGRNKGEERGEKKALPKKKRNSLRIITQEFNDRDVPVKQFPHF